MVDFPFLLPTDGHADPRLERSLEIPTVTDVPADDGSVSVRPAALDAFKVSTQLLPIVRHLVNHRFSMI